MATKNMGETAILELEVTDSKTEAYVSPTSMTVTIYALPDLTVKVGPVGMDVDDLGKFHYDWLCAAKGEFLVEYIATNGTRVSMAYDLIMVN